MMKPGEKVMTACLLTLLLLVLCPLAVLAQGQSLGTRPHLGGHSFVESVLVPSPFVRSYLRNRLGAGKAFNLATGLVEIDGQPVIGQTGDLVFALLDFEFQYAIKPWVAIRARVMGAGRLGSDTMTLLSEGVTMTTGLEFGWLIRLHESRNTSLSLDLNLADRSFTGVNLTRFIEEIIAEEPASLVKQTPSVRGGGGLRFAWAASPLLGVSGKAMTGYGESVERSKGDVVFWSLGTALDFDFREKLSMPLGVAVGYSYDSFPEFGADVAKGVSTGFLRLSYLGREDFLFSLDLTYEKIPMVNGREDVDGVSAMFSFRYYL